MKAEETKIQDLDNLAKELPKQYRAKLYEIVGSFFSIGAGYGAISAVSHGRNLQSNNEEEFIKGYLRTKAEEYFVK